MTRLIGLVLGLLAVFPASAQVHVPSSASSENFLASSGIPAIWLPELDAGIPMSGARVFVPGNVAAGRGVPLAFALDGGSIPLTINVDTTYHDPKAEGNWVPFTNMTVAHGYSVNGAIRNVVSPGLYRFFVYDGDGLLDDVTIDPRLGADQATTFEPGEIIYAAYLKNLNLYHAVSTDGGITYDPSYTGGSRQGKQAQFPGTVTGLAGLPRSDLLVGTTAGDTLDHAALFRVDRLLTPPVLVEDGGHLGGTLEGLAVYHADDVGDGGRGDWALVSSDGHLLLYEVNPNFGFITELVIDSADPSPYFQGVAVSNLALGPYDKGVAVVFDATDTITGAGQLLFVRWDDIVNAVDGGLAIDTSFDVRAFNINGQPNDGPGNTTPGTAHPPLGGGIGGRNSLMNGSCGGGAGPMLPVAGALVLLGGFAGRRRRR